MRLMRRLCGWLWDYVTVETSHLRGQVERSLRDHQNVHMPRFFSKELLLEAGSDFSGKPHSLRWSHHNNSQDKEVKNLLNAEGYNLNQLGEPLVIMSSTLAENDSSTGSLGSMRKEA